MRDVVKYFADCAGDSGSASGEPASPTSSVNAGHDLRDGTTAYLKIAHHAPAVGDAQFFPLLVLDAVSSPVPRASICGL